MKNIDMTCVEMRSESEMIKETTENLNSSECRETAGSREVQKENGMGRYDR